MKGLRAALLSSVPAAFLLAALDVHTKAGELIGNTMATVTNKFKNFDTYPFDVSVEKIRNNVSVVKRWLDRELREEEEKERPTP